ncbi:MAG TPA: sugar ABC transporter substrate-binding protein [Burkholderiales bacterium]|nr:sugar ABC transporter substrate-binding protein [Burkholderiales bacterium]
MPRSLAHACRRLCCLGAGILLLGACTPQAAPPETLRFWAMGREGEALAQLMQEFERTHPGIRIEIQQIPWTAAHEKLLTAFAAGTLPDLCQLGNTWIPEFAALNALEPLDARIDASAAIATGDYFPGIWDTNVIDGRLLGIPWYVDTRVLFYRSDLLKRAGIPAPPRTWPEWARALGAVKRAAGADAYAILLPLDEFEPLLALGLQQPGDLLGDSGRRGRFSAPGFRAALGFYAGMFRNGWAPANRAGAISSVWAEFARGYFAFYISGPWNIAEFKRRMPAELRNDWMTAPLPGPHGPGASIAGGASLVMFRPSRHARAAWSVVEYLSTAATQARFHELTGDLPPRRSAWREPALAGDPYARAFREQLERARAAPKVPEWERIAGEMQLAAEQVVAGRTDIAQATAALDRRVDAILEKRRWMLDRKAGR